MASKLDQKFAESVRVGVNALILEVERLEALQEKKDKALEDLMDAYERVVRSAISPGAGENDPWRVHEYVQAEEALK